MPHLYAAADVTLCRAGANSLAEILALHLPNVLVPLPLSASRGDQILNAQSFEKKGFSLILEQEKMTADTILASVQEVYENREKYRQQMAEDPAGSGTERVLAVIHEALAARSRGLGYISRTETDIIDRRPVIPGGNENEKNYSAVCRYRTGSGYVRGLRRFDDLPTL